jgi:hypothetical protein
VSSPGTPDDRIAPSRPGFRRTRHGAAAFILFCAVVGISACEAGRPLPPATSPDGSESTGPSAESFERIFAGRRTLNAGETVNVPLTFEGASAAILSLYAPTGSLTARIGQMTLLETPIGNGFSTYDAELTDPIDGDLMITNGSTSAVDVDATASIATGRQLVVSVPPTGIAGQPFTVEIKLSNAADGETPSVVLVDDANVTTPVAISASGPGAWVGTVTPPRQGGFRVAATIGGDQPRSAVDLIDVASPDGSFGR